MAAADFNAGCQTLAALNRAGRVPRCPVCGAVLAFSSSDQIEGADYYRCPADGERVKWWW
jgi:hypothetical protein